MKIISHKDYISKEELKILMAKNNFKAAFGILSHWFWIVFSFAIVILYPSVWVAILSVIILGACQLNCAILLHDAGHGSVFTNQKLNDFVGKWFGAYPVFNNLESYRKYHNLHHALVGSSEDPDILLTRGYPTTKYSMFRKFLRDSIGITGLKAFVGLFVMNLGLIEYNLGNKIVKVNRNLITMNYLVKNAIKNLTGPIVANLLMFFILWYASNNPYLYLLWIVAYFTTFQIIIRIRSIAEHSIVEDFTNPFKNTRTTKANFIEAFLFAPYNVNYHSEHHMLSGVPFYNLKKMHKILKEKGFYEKGTFAKSYLEVLNLTIKKD